MRKQILRKLSTVCLALLMVVSLAVPALAAQQTTFSANDKTPINAQVCVKPQKLEMKNGKLVARCYIINGMDRPIWITGDQTISVYSNGKRIAYGKATIPQDEEYEINPGKYELEDFTFGEHEFDKTASLENITINSSIVYQWADE